MFYINLSYIQYWEFEDFNNKVYTKDHSTMIWLKNYEILCMADSTQLVLFIMN